MGMLPKDIKKLTASALIDVVAELVGGPIGAVIPIIGNTVFGIKDNMEIKEQINSLEESQQEQIKAALEDIYNKFSEERATYGVEVVSIDVLETFFRGTLMPEEVVNINNILCEYCSGGVQLGDDYYDNGHTNVLIDTYMISQDSLILNLLDPSIKEDAMEMVNFINEILSFATNCNEVKKIVFY